MKDSDRWPQPTTYATNTVQLLCPYVWDLKVVGVQGGLKAHVS
jgi:hypothetical protein